MGTDGLRPGRGDTTIRNGGSGVAANGLIAALPLLALWLYALRRDALRLYALRRDTLRLDALRRDTLRFDTLRFDTLRRDALRLYALRRDGSRDSPIVLPNLRGGCRTLGLTPRLRFLARLRLLARLCLLTRLRFLPRLRLLAPLMCVVVLSQRGRGGYRNHGQARNPVTKPHN